MKQIPLTTPDEWRFKATLIRILILFAYPITTYYLIYEIRRANWLGAGLDAVFMVLFLVALLLLRIDRGGNKLLQYAILSRAFFIALCVLHFYSYALNQGFSSIPQMIMFPFLAVVILGRREGLIWTIVYFVIVGAGAVYQAIYSDVVLDITTVLVTVLAISVLVTADVFLFESVRQKSHSRLLDNQKELKKSNRLLEATTQEAEAANRAKSQFLANMSHELRTPLNHIIGFTEVVREERVGKLDDTQKEYLGDVLESSRHLLSLINDILDMSKIEAGKMELQPSGVDVETVIQQGIRMVHERAEDHGINVSATNASAVRTIVADSRKLKQILYNLLSNAVKFTPDGGGVALEVTERDADSLLFSVADTGIGIEKGHFEKIFHPFDQVNTTASREYTGSGLGLSITRSMVELHGGSIWLESDGPGKGTTFYFSIPRVTTIPPAPPAEA